MEGEISNRDQNKYAQRVKITEYEQYPVFIPDK
jgi:hypothetical protein